MYRQSLQIQKDVARKTCEALQQLLEIFRGSGNTTVLMSAKQYVLVPTRTAAEVCRKMHLHVKCEGRPIVLGDIVKGCIASCSSLPRTANGRQTMPLSIDNYTVTLLKYASK